MGEFLLAAVPAALGRGNHLSKLVFGEVRTVEGGAQQVGIGGIGQARLFALQLRARYGAGFHQLAEFLDCGAFACHFLARLRGERECAQDQQWPEPRVHFPSL